MSEYHTCCRGELSFFDRGWIFSFISGDERDEVRWGKTDCLSLQNQDSKQLWKYRWQSPAGELLWKSLIESSCQGGWSNQGTCVFQVRRGHVESMINPAVGGGGFLLMLSALRDTSWLICIYGKQAFKSPVQNYRCFVGMRIYIWPVIHLQCTDSAVRLILLFLKKRL